MPDLIGQVGFIWIIIRDGEFREVVRGGGVGVNRVEGVGRVPKI